MQRPRSGDGMGVMDVKENQKPLADAPLEEGIGQRPLL